MLQSRGGTRCLKIQTDLKLARNAQNNILKGKQMKESNFRKLLKKVDEIVESTTAEDIIKFIEKVNENEQRVTDKDFKQKYQCEWILKSNKKSEELSAQYRKKNKKCGGN